MSTNSLANRLLGYPPNARLLILNADDFGMCQCINEALLQSLKEAITSSCTGHDAWPLGTR